VSGTQNAGNRAGDTIVDTLNWTSTVIASLAAGEYLIRHELIAVHQANNLQCKMPPRSCSSHLYSSLLFLPSPGHLVSKGTAYRVY
jgi:hypothetical protein